METINLGMIGISERNGHPFSFSAIINGYSELGLAESGWKVIYDYVRRRDRSEFGIDGLRVTHAWTQDKDTTKKLCDACLIPNAISDWKDMIGEVDAAIIARDDHENHFEMAMPFLKAGLHVFVDKPLSLDVTELRAFKPYLENGKLMSCSGMRYAQELDAARASLPKYGKIKLARGAILNSWENYGVHLLFAILGIVKSRAVSVRAMETEHMSVVVIMDDGSMIQIDALDEIPKTFRVDIWGTKFASSHEITDNFSMFRRMLWHFWNLIKNNRHDISAEQTLDIMRILIAGRLSKEERREVSIDEIQI